MEIKPKDLTICITEKDGKILLGMKKRGFGEGLWNGFGGKVNSQENESIDDAADREFSEESELTLVLKEKVGVIDFEFKDGTRPLKTHIFKVIEFEGDPKETEEMRPKWFPKNNLPLENMWPADRHWLPLLVEGKKFKGKFLYNQPSTKDALSDILEFNIDEVEDL